jgi:ADP-heptose:LPS heptosyltransferase
MSNILIIKHGSLGDIVQISGVLRDIRETYSDKKIFILTTLPYLELLSKCPYLDGVLIDKRLPRWNIFYLMKLKKMLSRFNFFYVFDLQNSSRTSFYRKYLLNIPNWSSTETILKKNEKKKDFDSESVLGRFRIQLDNSNVKTNYTLKPDFSWAKVNVDKVINQYFGGKFILLFPFCSPQLPHKKWPYFNNLIKIIKSKHPNFEIVIAPVLSEMEDSKKIESTLITNNNKPLNVMELAGLITKASYVIANDTGPAHMSAHLGQIGTVLFGHHTTANKVSIETDKFKAISVNDLNSLSAEKVYSEIKDKLELID